MQKKNLLKNPIAKGISLALGATIMSPLYAQEDVEDATAAAEAAAENTDYDDGNVVVITGIRGSLMKSMDTKRYSTGVVDAINSEDIGKFPDTNLAESLQRITGVSIDRSRGEGSRVTVRGFGADFNLVTLNRRQMPTNSGFGRSFDFGDLASEGVAGVEIYKTGRASVATGGIGATINIKSIKPLDAPGLNAGFGVKLVNDTSTRDGDALTPELSGVYSDTFLDDTFGVAVTASVQERNNGQSSISNSRWFEQLGSTISTNPNQVNQPGPDDVVGLPQQFIYAIDEWERTRTNAQIALQYRPIDEFKVSLDYTYAELTLDHRFNNTSYWFTPSGLSGTWSDGPIVSPILYTEIGEQPDFPMGAGVDASKNNLDSIGLNLQWDVTDRLRLTLDHHDSTSERSPNSRFGSNALITIAAFSRSSTTADLSSGIPVVTTTSSDPLSPDDMQITGSVFGNSWAEMNIEQTQFDGAFEIDADSSIDFGIAVSKLTNFESGSNVQRNTWGQSQASAFGTIADLVTPASLAGVYDNLPGGSLINNNFFLFDMADVARRAEFLESLNPNDPLYLAPGPGNPLGSCGTGFCADFDKGFGNQFVEETDSAYVQYNLTGDIGDYPFNLITGVRWEETTVTASAESQFYESIEWASNNEFLAVAADELVPSGLTDSYDVLLPSIDFDMELRDDIKVRASYSKTIARSGFGDLRGNLTAPEVLFFANGRYTANASVGNPGLIPHESDNYDLSAEWFYDDVSYFSIGYFDKSVVNFVTSARLEEVALFPDLAHPAYGPTYAAAIAALGPDAANVDIRNWIFTNLPNAPGVDVANSTISGVAGDGPALYDVDTRLNSDEAVGIDGFEIAWQHDFTDTGFGFIVNATFASGSAEFDKSKPITEAQFALPGLSDTRNLIGYYDMDGLQIRIAYNWRDEFFTGGTFQPSYTDEYEQWDINASYDLDNGITLFFEGINITDETNRTYARDYSQIFFVGQTGPRYNFGFRYSY
ncbi:MAG: TonB-dependent receptor [Gammaproteobacteria bacterium]|nr:TonB-dependent receptor [Gammaproteobacteria bacterium]NNJ72945.1 TonB-dependent receptor [Enterobacterales bacterium]